MAATELLERLSEIESQKIAAAQSLLDDIVERLAADDEPDMDEVTKALSANGKTTSDLMSAVQAVRHRNKMRRRSRTAKPPRPSALAPAGN